MIRYILLIIIVAAASAWLWANPGIVEIHIMDFSIAMQLGTFIVLLIAAVLVFKILWQILRLPTWWRQRLTLRNDKQTNQQLTKLCIQLSEGKISKVANSRRYGDHLPNHLMTLLAQSLLSQLSSRQVSESILSYDNAEGLIRWIEGLGYLYHGEGDKAQEALRLALVKYPKHAGIITVLAHSYYQDAQWALLYDLIRQYKRYMPTDIIALYEDDVTYEYLLSVMDQSDDFDQAWRKLPYESKHSIQFIDLRIEHLLNEKNFKQAKTYIEKSLQMHWQDVWVEQYMTIPGLDPQKRIKQLLSWLKQEPNNVVLLNALAQAHLGAEMIARAGTYYEAAFSQSGHVSEGLALLSFYQSHQPEKVTQCIPHITRLI